MPEPCDTVVSNRAVYESFVFDYSEVKVYDASKDSTLPSVPKKRKFDEVDESADSTPKKVKTEENADADDGKNHSFIHGAAPKKSIVI